MANGDNISKTHPSLVDPKFRATNNLENFKVIYKKLNGHDVKISGIETNIAVIRTNICWIKRVGGSGTFLVISLLVAILTKLMFYT